jgi:hypothetical protein
MFGNSVAGDIVLANPLPLSSSGGIVNGAVVNGNSSLLYVTGEASSQSFSFLDQVLSFSFTDGVDTITNSMPGVNSIGGGFITNASGNITQGSFAATVTNGAFGGHYDIDVNMPRFINHVCDEASYGFREKLGIFPYSNSATATSSAPGTWTEAAWSLTSPACAAAIKNAVAPTTAGSPLSATDQPTVITATFTPNGVPLAQAAMDCGVKEFDWQQKIANLPNPSQGPQRRDGKPLTSPIYDPQPSNWNYPLYCHNKFVGTGVPSVSNQI